MRWSLCLLLLLLLLPLVVGGNGGGGGLMVQGRVDEAEDLSAGEVQQLLASVAEQVCTQEGGGDDEVLAACQQEIVDHHLMPEHELLVQESMADNLCRDEDFDVDDISLLSGGERQEGSGEEALEGSSSLLRPWCAHRANGIQSLIGTLSCKNGDDGCSPSSDLADRLAAARKLVQQNVKQSKKIAATAMHVKKASRQRLHRARQQVQRLKRVTRALKKAQSEAQTEMQKLETLLGVSKSVGGVKGLSLESRLKELEKAVQSAIGAVPDQKFKSFRSLVGKVKFLAKTRDKLVAQLKEAVAKEAKSRNRMEKLRKKKSLLERQLRETRAKESSQARELRSLQDRVHELSSGNAKATKEANDHANQLAKELQTAKAQYERSLAEASAAKDASISKLKENLRSLQERLKAKGITLQEAIEEKKRLQAEFHERESKRQKLRGDLKSKNDELTARLKEAREEARRLEAYKSRFEAVKTELQTTKERLAKSERNDGAKEWRSKAQNLEKKVQSLEKKASQLATVSQELREARKAKSELQKKLDAKHTNSKTTDEKIASLKEKLAQAERALQKAKEKHASLDRSVGDHSSKSSKLQAELQSLREENAKLTEKLEKAPAPIRPLPGKTLGVFATTGFSSWTPYHQDSTINMKFPADLDSPVVLTQLSAVGGDPHTTLGSGAIYAVTGKHFQVYIRRPGGVNPSQAKEWKWEMTYIAMSSKLPHAGRTSAEQTQHHTNNMVQAGYRKYTSLVTHDKDLGENPRYIVRMGGFTWHWLGGGQGTYVKGGPSTFTATYAFPLQVDAHVFKAGRYHFMWYACTSGDANCGHTSQWASSMGGRALTAEVNPGNKFKAGRYAFVTSLAGNGRGTIFLDPGMMAGAATLNPNPKAGDNAFKVTISFVGGDVIRLADAQHQGYELNWFAHPVTHSVDGKPLLALPIPAAVESVESVAQEELEDWESLLEEN